MHDVTTLLVSRIDRKFGESGNKVESNYKMFHIWHQVKKLKLVTEGI